MSKSFIRGPLINKTTTGGEVKVPLSDYEHWNEEASIIWYQEEGKHEIEIYEEWTNDFEPDYDFTPFDDEEIED
jgi:hypothetical protein